MPQLMDVLKLGRCSHEFSWPRKESDGDFYQVCLVCAVCYRYDWKTMKRTHRVEQAPIQTATVRRPHSQEKKPSWIPRARRLKMSSPVRYRVKNLGVWYEGIIENISASGVLLKGTATLPQNTLLELVFEMPEEISGQQNSSVLCQGRAIRCKDMTEATRPGKPAEADFALPVEMAVSIIDYKFLRSPGQ